MKKALRKPLFYFPLVLIFVGIPLGIYLAISQLEEKLNQGIRFHEAYLQTENMSISLNWPQIELSAGKVQLEVPGVEIKIHSFFSKLRVFSSSFSSKPFFEGEMDSLYLVQKGKKSDSFNLEKLRFPEFKVPRSIQLSSKKASFHFSNELVQAQNIRFKSKNNNAFSLESDSLENKNIPGKARLELDYNGNRATHNNLSLQLKSDSEKANMQITFSKVKGELKKISGDVFAGDLEKWVPYRGKINIPFPEKIHINYELNFGTDFLFSCKIQGFLDADSIPFLKDFSLKNHEFQVGLNYNQATTDVSLLSQNNQGQKINLQLSGPSLTPGEIKNKDFSRVRFDVIGQGKNLDWPLASQILPLDFNIRNAQLFEKGLRAEVESKDGSQIKGNLTWSPKLRAEFKGNVSATESWMTAWTKDHVHFKKGKVNAVFENKLLKIYTSINKATAYGAEGDSVFAIVGIRKDGLTIDSGLVEYNEVPWNVEGEINWLAPNRDLKFTASNPNYGRAIYVMPDFKSMSASVSRLHGDKTPYRKIETLYKYKPVVTGIYQWDLAEKTGKTDLVAQITLEDKSLELNLAAQWDSSYLNMDNMAVKLRGQELVGSGRFKLFGQHYYNLYPFEEEKLETVQLNFKNLDVAPWILEQSKAELERLVLNGQLTYNPLEKLHGEVHSREIAIPKMDSIFLLTGVSAVFKGNNLKVKAYTQSEKMNMLNDTVSIDVANIFSKNTLVEMEIVSQDSLFANMSGHMIRAEAIKGELKIWGNTALPFGHGHLSAINSTGTFYVPLNKEKSGDLLFEGQVEKVKFKRPEFEPLSLNAFWRFANNKLLIEKADIYNPAGEAIAATGQISWPLRLNMSAVAPKFTLPFEDNGSLLLENSQASLTMDSAGMLVNCEWENGFFQRKNEVMELRFNTRGKIDYELPRAQKQRIQTRKITGQIEIEDSYFMHNTFGMANFRNFFRPARKGHSRNLKKSLPYDIRVLVELKGGNNIINTSLLRTKLEGEVQVLGGTPQITARGELTSLTGQFGFSSQFYKINDLSLRWNDDPLKEGWVELAAQKVLAKDCRNPESDSCIVDIRLAGPFSKPEFSFDGTCGQDLGQNTDPMVFLNSIGRGCFDPLNSGEAAAFVWMEGQMNKYATSGIRKLSGNTIKNLRVSGTRNILRNKSYEETSNNSEFQDYSFEDESISLEIETAEKKGFRLRARSGYIPYSTTSNWEHEGAVEWRIPKEDSVSREKNWKDKLSLESKLKSTPLLETEYETQEEDELRFQFGVRYKYDFWDLW